MYKVEKGIPLPKVRNYTQPRSIYPWEELKVGDSFLVKPKGDEPRTVIARLSPSATSWGKRHNKKFTLRTVEKGAVRVWRVK